MKRTRYWLWISAFCAGCTAQSPLVDHQPSPTMIEIYQRHMSRTPAHFLHTQGQDAQSNGETLALSEMPLKRHPVLHMYVFPHRSEADGVDVPGYWTTFELYERLESRSNHSKD